MPDNPQKPENPEKAAEEHSGNTTPVDPDHAQSYPDESFGETMITTPDRSDDTYIIFEDLREVVGIKPENTLKKFENLKTIGVGGVGSVMGAHDPVLGRDLAIKVLRPRFRNKRKPIERFIREAKASAQIEHPNIVPIHDLGVLEDVGAYFTMKKVEGENLDQIIEKIRDKNPEYRRKYNLMRMLEIFISICQGVAFAHSRGIIHRDLKPENVMIGDFGEVLVMDWGLVKHLDEIPSDEEKEAEERGKSRIDITAEVENTNPMLTIEGSISGTPMFMSPEQAKGQVSQIDRQSDIYCLGVILYSILTHERSPFDTVDGGLREVLDAVVSADYLPPRKRASHTKVPRELEAICLKAMAKNKKERYKHTEDLIEDIRNYISGFPVSAYQDHFLTTFWKFCKRHPVISTTISALVLTIVIFVIIIQSYRHFEYCHYMAAAEKYLIEGNKDYKEARDLQLKLNEIHSKTTTLAKSPLEIKTEKKLRISHSEMLNNYELALMLFSKVEEFCSNDTKVNNYIEDIYRNRIRFSILREDYEVTKKLKDQIMVGVNNDSSKLTDSERKIMKMLDDIIAGKGFLEINTTPVQAEVYMWELKENSLGIIRPTSPKELGLTPIPGFDIAKGSYLLTIEAKGYPIVRYPVKLNHGETVKTSIFLPKTVPEGMVYIPAGPFYVGGEYSRNTRLHRVNLPGFFIKQYEVTFGEYLKFWKQIKDPKFKQKYRGRIRFKHDEYYFLNAWNDRGKLFPTLNENLPVTGISHQAASAYCAWFSKKTGMTCRLPSANEWEKAARGVDGRNFVWGNKYFSTYAYIFDNTQAHKMYGIPAPPGSLPYDRSIYGVYDMGGNVREYTSTKFPPPSPFYRLKGASAHTTRRFVYCAYSSDTPVVPTDIGFRYVIPLDHAEKTSKPKKQ